MALGERALDVLVSTPEGEKGTERPHERLCSAQLETECFQNVGNRMLEMAPLIQMAEGFCVGSKGSIKWKIKS